MKHINLKQLVLMIIGLGFAIPTISQNKTFNVEHFDKVIVSPHIEVVFKQGNEESVIIEDNKIPSGIFNIEVKSKTLHLYLDDAKITSPTETVEKNGYKQKVPIYKGTLVKVIVTYKHVETFSLRGEERLLFESPIDQDKVVFKIYGESQVFINSVKLNDLRLTIYGESYLEINNGTIHHQKIAAYGESKINTLEVDSKEIKLTAYGDGSFRFNVSNKLKVTSYGEATIAYKGNAKLSKGLVIGETELVKL